MGTTIWYAWAGMILLAAVTGSVAETEQTGLYNSGFLFGNQTADLLEKNFSYLTAEPGIPWQGNLQAGYHADFPKTDQAVYSGGEGWQEIAMPAVITSPGMYRVMNDYTSSGTEIGVLIISSDVILDGNGHEFTGNPDQESYAVAATANTVLP